MGAHSGRFCWLIFGRMRLSSAESTDIDTEHDFKMAEVLAEIAMKK